jgi:protein-S-isoprenylcysteine O-methyltransferase Ste14
MPIRETAIVMCVAAFVFMMAVPIWILRSYRQAMKQPSGKRLIAGYIIAVEAVLVAGIINIAVQGFWSVLDVPLVLPCIGIVLTFGGLAGMFWAGYKLYPLNKS